MIRRCRPIACAVCGIIIACDRADVSPGALGRTFPVAQLNEDWRTASDESSEDMRLTAITSLTVLPDGRVLTTHGAEAVVRVFDSTGTFIRTLGRRGQGPGEFTRPGGIGWVGDTIWVADFWGAGFVLFDLALEPIGTLKQPARSGIFPGIMSGGRVLAAVGESLAVVIGDGKGDIVARPGLNASAVAEEFQLTAAGARRTYVSPFRSRNDIALARGGGREAVNVAADAVWGGKPGQIAIRRLSPNGQLSDPMIVSLQPQPMPAEIADSIVDAWASRRAEHEELRSRVTRPDRFPPFRSIELYADGLIWLREYNRPGTRLVIDTDSHDVFRVEIPTGLLIHHATREHVWGTVNNADGLPIIIRYRIVSG